MSNGEKRTVSTDALETLGMIHTRQEYRDAIHLAVEPVVAGQRLKAGDHIGLKDGIAKKKGVNFIGIVDPFIERDVEKGESFWLVIYPRKITSLRHVWSHPDFDDTAPSPAFVDPEVTAKEEAYKWIEEYADSFGSYSDSGWDGSNYTQSVTADELIDHAKYWINNTSQWGGDYLSKGGLFEGTSVSSEFWNQLEIYLGEEIQDKDRSNFFTCSC